VRFLLIISHHLLIFSAIDKISTMNLPPESNEGSSFVTRNERIALIVIFFVALLYAGWQYYVRSNAKVPLGSDIPSDQGGIVVQVEGAVANPGLVYLPAGSRISDAIEAAGGFSSDADRNVVNLASIVQDGQRIDVPRVNQQSSSAGSGRYNVDIQPVNIPLDSSTGANRSTSGLVNINTSDINQLASLPGIGPELAQRIIGYRTINGGFRQIEDIMQVAGIGEGRFGDIKDLITVGD
jgi:competence protein ComEA